MRSAAVKGHQWKDGGEGPAALPAELALLSTELLERQYQLHLCRGAALSPRVSQDVPLLDSVPVCSGGIRSGVGS